MPQLKWHQIDDGPMDENLDAGSKKIVNLADPTSAQDAATKAWVQTLTTVPVPSGGVMSYAGSSAPTGWLLCYGQAVSRTTYADLFSAISTTYGVGDSSTTFNLPDLRGRVAAGKDDMGGSAASRITTGGSGINGAALGSAGGAETHTLTTAQMPAHTHTVGHELVTKTFDGSTNHGVAVAGTITSSSTGGGGAHNNMPPAIMLNFIIKT